MIWSRPMRGIDFAIWMPIAMLLAVLLPGLVAAAIYMATPAHGHDHTRPQLLDWLKGLHNAGKALCCDGNDTDAIDEWKAEGPTGYRVKFRGMWFDVPETALVVGPNNSGTALLWMNKGWGGVSVRCFMPGSMT